jgi:hypothetical protein
MRAIAAAIMAVERQLLQHDVGNLSYVVRHALQQACSITTSYYH